MVKIITDTTSCISLEEANRLGIGYIPQIIVIGDETYRDDTEIDSPTFLQKLQSAKTLPKTAAPPPVLYNPLYEEAIAKGQSIIVICPSAQVSGTVRSATLAAQEFPGADIRVIDTLSIGTGLGSMVLAAQKWADEGLDADTIEVRVKDMVARCQIYFLVDTLEYLHKGGRIGAAQAIVGSILQVKPILAFKDGHTEAVESQRTKRRAIARIHELIKAECPAGDESFLSIMQVGAEEEAAEIAETFKSDYGIKNVPIAYLPPAIIVHAGPGALAFSFFKASK